jgi:ABC-type nitrate/sulfonate/bicarbonate transport system ATPase subunit
MGTLSTVEAPIIEARQIEKFYTQPDGGRVQVIAPTDLAVYHGQIVAVLGPSGCGKSTLLRMLTGLQPAAYCGTVNLFAKNHLMFLSSFKALRFSRG